MSGHINALFFEQLLLSKGGILFCVTLFVFMISMSSNIFVKIFNLIAGRIIYKQENQSYAIFASLLLNLLIIVTVAGLVWSFHNLIPFDILYDYCALLFCLEFASVRKYAKGTSESLRQNNNEQAKAFVHPYILRDVSSLSSMGIAKATVESIPLNFLSGWFVPAFWYLAVNADAALAVSFFSIMNKAFNVKQPLFCDFGKLNSMLYKVTSFLPNCFLILALQFGKNSLKGIQSASLSTRSHPYWFTGFTIGCIAGMLNVSLGGPRFYDNVKIRYGRVGMKTEPAPVHIDLAYKKLRNAVFITLIFVIIGQIAWIL